MSKENKEIEVIEVNDKRVHMRILNLIYTFTILDDGRVVFEGRGSYERDPKESVDVRIFRKAFRQAAAILRHKRQKIAEKQELEQIKLF
jgi:hypothetical protein